MKYVTGEIGYTMDRPSAVSLGKFDGLHRGHRKLLDEVLKQKKNGLASVIFTFTQNPTRVLSGLSAQNIITNEERRAMLEEEGIDCLVECPFVPELAHMEPERFVEKILVEQLKAVFIAVGTDFHFGYQRRGDYQLLQKLGDRYGFQVEVVEKAQSHGRDISSTYVKEELDLGNIEKANELLGEPYSIHGTVVHGNHLGGPVLGFPTVNIIPPEEKYLPPFGVYVSRVRMDDRYYGGITNIGRKPTVGKESPIGVETFLFDAEGDFYGKNIEVQLLNFERPEQKFPSLDDLKKQLEFDQKYGRSYLDKHHVI